MVQALQRSIHFADFHGAFQEQITLFSNQKLLIADCFHYCPVPMGAIKSRSNGGYSGFLGAPATRRLRFRN
jgi:hypothetical protein